MWPERCCTHDGEHGAHDIGNAPEIGGELLLELRGRQLLEIPKKAVARVIHENVDAAKFPHGFIDCAFCLLFVRNVELDEGEIVVCTLKGALELFKIAAGSHYPVTRFRGPPWRYLCRCRFPHLL